MSSSLKNVSPVHPGNAWDLDDSVFQSANGTLGDLSPQAIIGATNAASTLGSTNLAAKPVGTIAQLSDYLVNGFWAFNNTIAHHWASSTITYNISGLTAAEQTLAQSALEASHEVANVTFVLTTGAADITFNHSGSMTAFETDNYNSAGIMSSATVDISMDWITTDGGANDGKTGIDSYGYQTYIHEIGHALGLGHQGPYNGSAVYSTDATYANDTWQYSVMSYFAEDNYSGSSYRYVVTPQMVDIYAVQSIYGAANTRGGDTVYGFHDTAGSIFDFTAYTQAPALTIYDSGGNDTLDCSGYSASQTINLNAGSFSSVGGLVNNIGISTTTIIEHAIGGSGSDTLIANAFGCTLDGSGGNDTLIGGAGNDTLIGGSGTDTVVFTGNESNYLITYNSVTQTYTLVDERAGSPDGTDTVTGVEAFTFANGTFAASALTVTQSNPSTVNDFSGDAKSDLVWFNSNTHQFTEWQSTGNGFTINSVVGSVGPGWVIATTGDFDDNGKSDLIWFNSGTAQFTEWQSTGSGLTQNVYVGAVAAGWTIAGAGDFSGDGKSDLLWFNANSHQFTVWNSTGNGFTQNSIVGAVGAGWTIVGTGDYNGDGKSDLIWFNSSTQQFTEWQSTGSGFTQNVYVGAVSAGWTIVGSGDFVGNGMDDLVWFNNSTHQYTIWDSTGNGFTQNSFVGSVAAGWTLAGTGDYNGDGKSDLLWYSSSNQFTEWQSTGSGFTQNVYVGAVGSGWTMPAVATKSEQLLGTSTSVNSAMSEAGAVNADAPLKLAGTSAAAAFDAGTPPAQTGAFSSHSPILTSDQSGDNAFATEQSSTGASVVDNFTFKLATQADTVANATHASLMDGGGFSAPAQTDQPHSFSNAVSSGDQSTAFTPAHAATDGSAADNFTFKPETQSGIVSDTTHTSFMDGGGFSAAAQADRSQANFQEPAWDHLQSWVQATSVGHDAVIDAATHDALINARVSDLQASSFMFHHL